MGIWIPGALLLGLIVGFVVGVFVYRNNSKRFEKLLEKVNHLPAEKKAEIEKLLKEIGL